MMVARKVLKKTIDGGSVDIKLAAGYMWHYMGKIKGTLEEAWIANTKTIGNANAEITPRDLLNGKPVPYDPGADTGEGVSDAAGWGLFWSMVGVRYLLWAFHVFLVILMLC